MPDRIVGAQTDKPAEQQVVVQLLEQQPLRADPVERLQQRGQQQLLRRHRGPAFRGLQLTEGGIESIEGLIREFSDPPKRMIGRDPLLDRDVGEQGPAALLLTSHLNWVVAPFRREGLVFQQTSNHSLPKRVGLDLLRCLSGLPLPAAATPVHPSL